MTFNARIETLFEKPSFRAAAPAQRCLLAVNGFWEYQHLDRSGALDPEGKVTRPYVVRLASSEVMLLGGLWTEWNGQLTFTIVTKPANTLMSRIHNAKQRMPVIVPDADAERWLAGGGPRELEPFAEPRDDDGLVADDMGVPSQGDLFG
jgi:putative SOS response-associated peptidase YedK